MVSLKDIHEEFSARLGSNTVVAGGAVRDYLMVREPKDYDIFMLDTQYAEPAVNKVMGAIAGLEKLTPLEWHRSEPYLVVTVKWLTVDIQIMCSPAPTVGALLDTFDWNVCLFAYDGRFTVREDVCNIKPGAQLKLQQVRFPLSTLRRGFRFSERFQMVFTREDQMRLCRQTVEKRGLPGVHGAIPDMPSLGANVLVEFNG